MSTDITEKPNLSERTAEEIRAWMGRRKKSGAAMARALGVSSAWVSYRLSGAQEIGLNDLERIADFLGLEVTDLLPRPMPGRVLTAVGTGETPVNHRSTASAERTRVNRRLRIPCPTGRPRPEPTHPASPEPPTRRRPMPVTTSS